jgi:hypothetical protein
MPASFDDKFSITNGEITPKGPLGDLANKGTIHLHFWVVQMQGGKKGAFMQAQGRLETGDPTRWEMAPTNIHRHGKFVPGNAFATAVAMLDPDDQMDWWATTVELV